MLPNPIIQLFSPKPATEGSPWENTWTCDPVPQGRLSCSALSLWSTLQTNSQIKVIENDLYPGECWSTCTEQFLSVTCAPWDKFKVHWPMLVIKVTIAIFFWLLKSMWWNDNDDAPVGDVFVGVWINVLLGKTKVHNEHNLVLLHTGPTIQVQIRIGQGNSFLKEEEVILNRISPADEEVLRLDVSVGEHIGYQGIFIIRRLCRMWRINAHQLKYRVYFNLITLTTSVIVNYWLS